MKIDPKKKKKGPLCPTCKGLVAVNRVAGHGYCEACSRTTPIPIGHVVSRGSQEGKFVYLASAILGDLTQDMTLDEAYEELERELKRKHFIIIDNGS